MTTFILPILYHHHHHNCLNHRGSQAIPYMCIIARRKKDIHCRPVKPTIHYFCTIHNIHDMVSNLWYTYDTLHGDTHNILSNLRYTAYHTIHGVVTKPNQNSNSYNTGFQSGCHWTRLQASKTKNYQLYQKYFRNCSYNTTYPSALGIVHPCWSFLWTV